MTRAVNLEETEDFSQLCVIVNLVKVMPGTQLLLSVVKIEDETIRLWRDWLKNQAHMLEEANRGDTVEEEVIVPGGGIQSRQIVDESSMSDDYRMLWVDERKNVGLKVRVREKKWNQNAPILVSRDEDRQYHVDIEGMFWSNAPNAPAKLGRRIAYSHYSSAIDDGTVHRRATEPNQSYDLSDLSTTNRCYLDDVAEFRSVAPD